MEQPPFGKGRLLPAGRYTEKWADGPDGSAQPPSVQRDQAFPMAFGGWLVVTPALREGEAVMDGHLDLELARIARLVEQRLQLLHHVGRRELIVLGAGDIEFALGFGEVEMRTLNRVTHQPGAVERRRGCNAVGKACGGGQRVGSTHAVAVGADRSLLRLLLPVG